MKTKIFIDGREGTTGLRINERFKNRDDIELLTISEELRKDVNERKRLINEEKPRIVLKGKELFGYDLNSIEEY